MKKFKIKRILIPTDFSKEAQRAVDQAAFIARLCKADLYLLHAVDIKPSTFSAYDNMVKLPPEGELLKAAITKLNELARQLKKEFAISVKTLCSTGKVTAEVTAAVKKNKIDLVIMGTHGSGGLDEFFVGSNAARVVSECPCPVITVRSQVRKSSFSNIVLPVDNTSHSRQKVDAALLIAGLSAAKIHILGLPGSPDKEELAKFNIKLEAVTDVIKKSGLPYDIKIRTGDHVAEQAMKYAKAVKADLIVVMADHESRLGGPLASVFGKQLLNHSRVPVMSVKPEEGKYEFISLAGATGT